MLTLRITEVQKLFLKERPINDDKEHGRNSTFRHLSIQILSIFQKIKNKYISDFLPYFFFLKTKWYVYLLFFSENV